MMISDLNRTCLSKELRALRAHWLFVIFLIPLVLTFLGFFVDGLSPRAGLAEFVERVLTATTFIGIFVFGTEVVHGEYRKMSSGFMDRLPLSRTRAFFTKFIVAVGLLVTCLAATFLLTVAIWLIADGRLSIQEKTLGDLARQITLDGSFSSLVSYVISQVLLVMALASSTRRAGVGLIVWVVVLFFAHQAYDAMLTKPGYLDVALFFHIAIPSVLLALAWFAYVHPWSPKEKAAFGTR